MLAMAGPITNASYDRLLNAARVNKTAIPPLRSKRGSKKERD